jgi:hypothetical protein
MLPHLERGRPLAAVLELAEVEAAIAENRDLYRITPSEHDGVMSQVTGSGGMLFERARALLPQLTHLASLRLGLAGLMSRDEDASSIARLLSRVIRRRILGLCGRQFSALLTLGESSEARWLAANISNILGADVDDSLAERVAADGSATWEDSLAPETVVALRGGWTPGPGEAQPSALPPPQPYHRVIDGAIDLEGNLAKLAEDEDPHLQALALTALSYRDLGRARQVASRIEGAGGVAVNWLLREAIASVLNDRAVAPGDRSGHGAVSITVAAANSPATTLSLDKPYITIGRHASNDVVVAHPSVTPFHLAISLERGVVELRRVDPTAEALVDGVRLDAPSVALRSGARIALRPGGGTSPTIVVDWSRSADGNFAVQRYDTVTKLIWLSAVPVFESLELEALAGIAETAEVRLYMRGAWLCRAGEPSRDAFVLQAGETDVFGMKDGRETRIGAMGQGSIIGEIGVITQRPRAASVRVRSATARVVAVNGERLRRLMKHSPTVAMGMLVGVASYLGSPGPAEPPATEKAA